MKKILICTFLTFFTFAGLVQAEQVEIGNISESPSYFQIELDVGTQSVWNNSIPIDIYLTPSLNSDRVEIRGNTPASLDFEYLGGQYFSVQEGETYRLRSRITPQKPGNYRVAINAIAWQYDTNYSSTSTINVQIDEDLKIVPQSSMYQVNLILKYVFFATIIALIGFGIARFGKKGYTKFKKWLLPNQD